MADFIFDSEEMQTIAAKLKSRGADFNMMLRIYEHCMTEISHTGFAAGKTSQALRAFPKRVRIAEQRIDEAYKIISENLVKMDQEVQSADNFSF